MSFLYPYVYFIALSFLASLRTFILPPQKDRYLKLFPPFLFLTLVAEIVGQYMSHKRQINAVLYNPFSVFEFCFYFWIISLLVKNKGIKKIIRIAMIVYAIAAIINIGWIQGIKTFHTNSYGLGCLLIVACCIYYFLELFRTRQNTKLIRNPAFWICSGLLIFYCCTFPLIGLLEYWSNMPRVLIDNFKLIVDSLNILLYTFFTIAFLCNRTRIYTLSRS